MTGERKYDVILLDVDGTLLNFDQAEADGMRVVLREYGVEPTDELLEAYHQVNNAYWAAFERGEVTKERLVCQRFETFFGSLGKTVDGAQVESLYRRQLDGSAILIDGAVEICGVITRRGKSSGSLYSLYSSFKFLVDIKGSVSCCCGDL